MSNPTPQEGKTSEQTSENHSGRRAVITTIIALVVVALIAVFIGIFRQQRASSRSTASSSTSSSQSSSSQNSSSDQSQKGSSSAVSATTIDPNAKTLILYFSLTGTTQQAAQAIHQELPKATLVRLEPQQAYGSYDDAARRGDRERRGNIHPAIKDVPNIESYQNIFIGFPTWWAQPPMLIHTLFDRYDFSGKTIIPFTTSSSTPMSASMPTMRQLAQKDNAKIIDGFRWDDDNSALHTWLRNMKAVN